MAKLSEQDRRDLSRALNYANWSFSGLIIPFIGLFFAGISLNIAKSIPSAKESQAKLYHITKSARLGFIVSLLAMGAWGGIYNYHNNQVAKENASVQMEIEARIDLRRFERNRCITAVDEWYNKKLTGYRTQAYWDNLLASKKQQISECQIKYPY